MSRTYAKGFSVVEVSLIVAVIAIIGGLGFVFYNKWQDSHKPAQTASTQQAAGTTITKTSDLDSASTALDSTDVTSSSDAAALNNSLSF